MATNCDYDEGYDNGYRAGLQKARNAIASGDLFTAKQVEQIKAEVQNTASHP